MSVTCSLSESSSECSCSCAAPANFLPLRLRDPNAFPFTTQPIVYYAEIPELYSKKQKGQEKKDKPNHFSKAFRWYTREHGLNEKTTAETQDIGFATWLDHKYQQYLRDRSKSASFKSEASNVPTPTANQDVVMQKSAKPKGLRRVLRSPWRKRHAAAKTPEGEIGCTECKSSWETILRPKSLSRLESENCAQKRSTTCGASSKVTVTSSDTQVTIRSKKRDLFVQEATVRIDDNQNLNQNISVIATKDTDEKSHRKSKIKVKCECPIEEKQTGTYYKTDMTTQYDSNINIEEKSLNKVNNNHIITSKPDFFDKSTGSVTPTSIATMNTYADISKEKNNNLRKKNTISKVHVICERPEKLNAEVSKNYIMDTSMQHEQNKTYEEPKTLIKIAQPDFTNKPTGLIGEKHEKKPFDCVCPKRSTDGAVQTSDCAITPENVTCGHPVLLRIISTR